MPNLNLTHSGNMSITSASITTGGTLNVGYQANDTGYITGWTITPAPGDTNYETGQTISVKFYPQYSGTVLSETFVVSGVDNAGVNRSDSSVITQDYNRDLSTYFSGVSGYWYYMSTYNTDLVSTAVTEDYLEVVIQPNNLANPGDNILFGVSSNTNHKYAGAFWNGWIKTTPAPLSSITINIPEYIFGSATATTTYNPESAFVDLWYESIYPQYATIDQNTGVITVLQNGWCTFRVYDRNTGLYGEKSAYVFTDDTVLATSITLSISNYVYEGTPELAMVIRNPSNATVMLSYTSSDTTKATVDGSGRVTAVGDGDVQICVTDLITGLSDCKTVRTHTYFTTPLTFEITKAGVLRWFGYQNTGYGEHTIQYSKNGGSWTSITSSSGDTAPSISVEVGDVVRFFGTNPTYYYGSTSQGWNSQGLHSSFGDIGIPAKSAGSTAATTCEFNVFGNVMSLVYGTFFMTNNNYETLTEERTFYGLFADCKIGDASKLYLPATAITSYCYYMMFSDSTVVYAPELPAENLAHACYYAMFSGCESLYVAPSLPSEFIASATECYCYMFSGCNSLTYIKCLARNNGSSWMYHWVDGVASSGTLVINRNISTTMWSTGINGAPDNWTIVNDS